MSSSCKYRHIIFLFLIPGIENSIESHQDPMRIFYTKFVPNCTSCVQINLISFYRPSAILALDLFISNLLSLMQRIETRETRQVKMKYKATGT
jgi:hypothetical protein